MNIVVLLKSLRAGPGSEETLPGLGPGERAALGTALALAGTDDLVTVLAAGPASEERCLEAGLRAGAAHAVRVTDPPVTDADQRTTATILTGGLRRVGFDLVLAGQRSANWSSGGTGPGVAHLLRLPHVTSVCRVQRHEEKGVLVTHRRERAEYLLHVQLPALLTVMAGPPIAPREVPDELPAVEVVSLAEMTLPFRKPLVTPDRQLHRVEGPTARMLEDVGALADLLRRWR